MTTKTTAKGVPPSETPITPTREEIQTAYQVHTLSRMLYGHLASAQSWNTSQYGHAMESQMGYPYGWFH
jgi:hypothetical protein